MIPHHTMLGGLKQIGIVLRTLVHNYAAGRCFTVLFRSCVYAIAQQF